LQRAIFLVAAMLFGFANTAMAEIQEFHVDVNPALATMRFEVPGIPENSLGCGTDPFACDFGLELDMRLQLDGLGNAQATVDELVLHGRRTVSGHPLAIALFYLKLTNEAADELTASEFIVETGTQPGQTRLTAHYPMGNDLVLEFDRAKLMSMTGGPDFRAADGPKYTFSYAVPEPSSFGLALIAPFGFAARCFARRGGFC
jgi:hypothetical protein